MLLNWKIRPIYARTIIYIIDFILLYILIRYLNLLDSSWTDFHELIYQFNHYYGNLTLDLSFIRIFVSILMVTPKV